MAAQDPLRQLMNMADDARSKVNSMVSQGTRQIKGVLPELPLPGVQGAPKLPTGLPSGPEELLANLPKLSSLGTTTRKTSTRTGSSKFTLTGPQVQISEPFWGNSHTYGAKELEKLPTRLQKNSVPTRRVRPKVLTK